MVSAIKEMDPQQPITEVRTLAQVRADNLASPRLTALLLGAFALLAIFITAAGIAGVIAYSVSQRTQEIGIRLALGAEPSSLLAMVVRQGMALVGLGLALGIVGGLAISRVMSGLVFSEGATVIDFAGPWEVFQDVHVDGRGPSMEERMPFRLYTVSDSRAPIHTSGGMQVTPDYTFADAPVPAIVVVGAQGGKST